MDRLHVLQNLVKHKKLNNYFEIGVFNGHILFKIKTTFKVAVDPNFKFDFLRKLGKSIINPYNLTNQYYKVTSDVFFKEYAGKTFVKNKIELSLIDGMHEYEFVVRDIENTLHYMLDHGVIIIHDCNPATAQAEVRFEDWNGEGAWNGNVWKAIVHLRSLRTDLNVFVLDCDHGLGIITKDKPEDKLNFSKGEIDQFTYGDLVENRQKWLNLKPQDYFYEYFKIPKDV